MSEPIHEKYKCKICGALFSKDELSEEHYPARSTGNEDIVSVDLVKMIETFQDIDTHSEITRRICNGETFEEICGDIFDTKLSKSLYPDGRTAKTLCKKCNGFLGKYDEAYLKFFNADGNSKEIKGFQEFTKHQIIKAIFAKFLSVPEAWGEDFDFVDYIKDEKATNYDGVWNLYFVKRDLSCDFLGLKDIGTGKIDFEDGVVYELSDDKFIFNLMNFTKHTCFDMTNIFEILNKNYVVTEGVGPNGGYHAQILLGRLLCKTEDHKVSELTE